MLNQNNSDIHSLLNDFGIPKQLRAGQIIQFQDDFVEDIFVVVDGLAIARFYEVNGKERWIDSFNKGCLIGIEYLQTGGLSQSQITARTDMTVLQFKRSSFQDLMARHKALNYFVVEQLITKLKRHQEVRLESHMLSKRGQIASEIWKMAECAETDTGYVVSPKPVISDMALRLGISRETVSRTVSELVKNQVLQRSTRGFIVPDLGRLEAKMN